MNSEKVIVSEALDVSKKAEQRLARMEARLEVEKENMELRRKATLVKNKLQRCHLLMKLLLLSKNRTDYFAFVQKCKEQRKNENTILELFLSDEASRRFCKWKVHVEKQTGVRLELRPGGELLIQGRTASVNTAKNMIQGYLGTSTFVPQPQINACHSFIG